MSSTPTAASTPARPSRRPFSLRELFCLLTLACMLLALFLSESLTNEERWLVGPACGAALLGILLARLCGRGAWLSGLVLGTLGAAVAIGREAVPSYGIYQHLAQRAPSRLPVFWTNLTIMTLSSLAVGFILALLACACFQLPLWATTSGENGMFAWVRRRPRRASFVGVAIISLLLALWQADAVIWPGTWVPRHAIPLPRLAPQAGNGVSMPGSRVVLSRHGDWVAVHLSGFVPNRQDRFKGTLLYRLSDRADLVELPGVGADQIEAATFSVQDEDVFAFLSYQMATDKPHDQLSVVDLATQSVLRKIVDPRRSLGMLDGDRLDWLPDGTIVHSAWSGGGAIVYDAATGKETGQLVNDTIYYDARLGHRYHVSPGNSVRPLTKTIRIVELGTERELNRGEEVLMSIPDRVQACRDGRFLLTRAGLRNGQSPMTTVAGEVWTFTKEDQVVVSANFHKYAWLEHIPFGERVATWLNRDAVRILDPATGEELARTRPVHSAIDSVAVSHDGARIAVLNLEGVYIYDVPAEFR